MLQGISAAIEAAAWEPEVLWEVSGPVIMFDAVRGASSRAKIMSVSHWSRDAVPCLRHTLSPIR